MPIDTFIPLPEAILKYGLTENALRAQIKVGKIRAGILQSGEIVVNEQDARAQKPTPKEELPEYKKHAKLKGQAIWVSEAARRYEIPAPTISTWVKKGIIAKLNLEGNRLMIDEADVAYCAEIYRKNGGQGKWLFNDDGTPYKPKASLVKSTDVKNQ